MCACLCVLPANVEAEDYISEKNPKEKEFRRVKFVTLVTININAKYFDRSLVS